MKYLTIKQTLKIAVEIWEWCRDTLSFNKADCPVWKKYSISATDNCILCEYAARKSGKTDVQKCFFCPLFGRWTTKAYSRCTTINSPFNEWEKLKRLSEKGQLTVLEIDRQRRLSNNIVNLCRKELDR